ncbi:hypothetical protein BCR33DRAFT_223078 [Rhizoclosmatium globosum]|uniref:GATA-type domain-containing protein n=1 Tax=Rhizoclosmatium globosum TaxID=329046 RepID=A0A1Y2CDT2_9FUNG|nr:hypothetical protein BCR33DRAFT_223078 [Rhizoclosmatium globosum]|eukprot:ORY44465.1 hypothetical protein BCR33DRAFT_223078 [Rhizoclosmatium globosum]
MAMLKEGKRKKQKKEESTMRTTQLLASGIASTIAGLVANVKRKHSDDESSSSDSDSSSSSDSDSDSESESEVIKMKQLLASFHSIQSQTQAGGSIQNAAPAQPKRISYAPPPKSCEFCEVTSTSTWRRGPSGVGTLCNKCGVRWAKNNRHYFPNSTVGSSSSVPKKKKQKASTEVGVVPVTYEQKVRLSSMIESLSEQHQASVFEMIRSAIPVSNEGEEIELDIEAIDDDSLRKLYDHVEKCVAEDQKVEAERQKAAQRVIEELQRNRGE